jgi:hypothetical protein
MALAAVVVVAAGATGYYLGRDDAPTADRADEIRGEAAHQALIAAMQDAAAVSRNRGARDGLTKGRAQGAKAGSAAGRSDGADDAAAAAAPAEPQQPEVVPDVAPPGGTGCGGNPYAAPGDSGGCIPPAHPPPGVDPGYGACPPGTTLDEDGIECLP